MNATTAKKFLPAFSALLLTATLQGADIVWTNTSGGNWDVAANWSPNQIPGRTDNVFITNDGTYSVVLNLDSTNASLILGGASGTQALVNSGFAFVLNGASAVNSNGVFKQDDGKTSFADLLNHSGKVQLLSGTMELGGGETTGGFEIGANATLNFTGAGTNNLSAASSVTGAGNFEVSGATVNLNGTFNVTATNTVSGGAATFVGNYTITNNTLNLSGGTANFNAGGTVSPVVLNLNGGTLGGTNEVSVTGPLNWTAGSITGKGLVNALGGLTISLSGGQGQVNGRTLVNFANGTWSIGTVFFRGGVLSNAVTGTFDIGSDSRVSLEPPASGVANAGTFRKIGTNYASVGRLTNSGTVELQSGMLLNFGTYLQTSGLTLLTGGSLSNALIRGGTLAGSGTVGAVINDSMVNPGVSSFGLLTVARGYTQTTNGALNINVGGFAPVSSYDHLAVGAANLAGALNLTFTNGFVPPPLALFTFMSYGSRSGTFTTFNYPSNEIGLQIVYLANVAAVQVVNVPPVLPPLPDRTADELTTLTVNAAATDADLPLQRLTYELIDSPPGAAIDQFRGVIFWTPTEEQGPMTTNITVRVTDNGTPPLSATRTFQVTVLEVNSPPVLTLPPDQTIHATTLFAAFATATDSDIPTNTFTFALVSGPLGLSIGADGLVTWTPTDAQANTTNVVSLRVTDDGTPSLSATNFFTITVVSRPLLDLPLLTPTNALLRWSAVSGLTYRVQHNASFALTHWFDLNGNVTATETSATKVDTSVHGTTSRYYRVRLVP